MVIKSRITGPNKVRREKNGRRIEISGLIIKNIKQNNLKEKLISKQKQDMKRIQKQVKQVKIQNKLRLNVQQIINKLQQEEEIESSHGQWGLNLNIIGIFIFFINDE